MSLPKLEIPTYELTQPSSGKKVKFRPFLVKEHKALLMVKDSSPDDISRVMEEIVDICTFNKLKMNNLPSFDIEYMFSRIRAKSIGEKLDLIISCRNCENKVDFKINLDDVQIQTDKEHQAKFMLNDSLGVEMKYPKFKINLNDLFQSGVEPFFQEIENCIKAIYTVEGKYIEIGPEDKEEVSEFVASMNTEQFAKIEKFFETMPKLSHVTDVLCDKCGAVNKARVEGLANFFV